MLPELGRPGDLEEARTCLEDLAGDPRRPAATKLERLARFELAATLLALDEPHRAAALFAELDDGSPRAELNLAGALRDAGLEVRLRYWNVLARTSPYELLGGFALRVLAEDLADPFLHELADTYDAHLAHVKANEDAR